MDCDRICQTYMVSLNKNILGETDPMESDIAKTTKVVRNLNFVFEILERKDINHTCR